jgi:uncharacterized protein YjbJ (UPF0337 family)
MNSDQLKGNWHQIKGKVKAQWGELTGDDIDKIDGQYEQFIGTIQERYGKSREAAEKELTDYLKKFKV